MDRSYCHHAPATFAYRNCDLVLRVILPDGEGDLIDLFLFWQTEGGEGRLRMLPEDGLYARGESYTVYAATLKAAALHGAQLTYHFAGAGLETERFCVPLTEEAQPDMGADVAPWPRTALSPFAVLPLSAERVYLSNGDLFIHLAVAGEGNAVPLVYVKSGNAFLPHRAHPSRKGLYEVRIPYVEAARAPGRLAYYVAVSGGGCTATLGSETAPLFIRIVDNAGPTVLSVAPAEGTCVGEERCPVICVRYEDRSGVDVGRSILCLDGRNVSARTEWGQQELRFQPRRPLADGLHTVEMVLRDGRGNRTLRQFEFYVGHAEGTSAQPAQGAAPKAHAIRAALFFAKAASTFKSLLRPKE